LLRILGTATAQIIKAQTHPGPGPDEAELM
jgi:hypothetical protein